MVTHLGPAHLFGVEYCVLYADWTAGVVLCKAKESSCGVVEDAVIKSGRTWPALLHGGDSESGRVIHRVCSIDFF